METAEDICSQEVIPFGGSQIQTGEEQSMLRKPGRDLEEPVSQQPMEEGGGGLQGRPLGLRIQVSSICTRLC